MLLDVRLRARTRPERRAFFHGNDRVWDVRVLYANHHGYGITIWSFADAAMVPMVQRAKFRCSEAEEGYIWLTIQAA
jgi:hypothetical protein